MNLGNNNNKPSKSNLDKLIEQLNINLSKLLGKNSRPNLSKPPSNVRFLIIILLSLIILWLSTGFYYLFENEHGLILINGKIVSEAKGPKMGFTLPYPFGDIHAIDTSPKIIDIGSNESGQNEFTVLDKNLSPVAINARLNYQIANPKKLYENYLQQNFEIDDEILWSVQSTIRYAIAGIDFSTPDLVNLTVLSNKILPLLTDSLSPYGIGITKLNILAIRPLKATITQESTVINIEKNNQQFQINQANESTRNLNDNESNLRSVFRIVDRNRGGEVME